MARAGRALLVGDFAAAEELAAQGLSNGQRASGQAVEVYHPGVIGCLRFMQGRFGETGGLYRDLVARYPAMPVFRTALAVALAEAARADQAQAELGRLTADDLAALPRDPAWSLNLAFLAVTCHHLGDGTLAVKLHRLLEPYADRHIATGRFGAFYLGRRPTSWACWTSPLTNPSRPPPASPTRPRSPAASGPARWWP
jgi:hypothetical protein